MPANAAAGRGGYFTIAAILAILSGLTVIGIVNPPAQNPTQNVPNVNVVKMLAERKRGFTQ